MHQPTFASVEFEQKKRKTRRELFLERIDGLVPWDLRNGSSTRSLSYHYLPDQRRA